MLGHRFLVVVYLLQLLLDRPLLLCDVAELGGVLLGEGPAGLLGRSLFSGQRLLGLAVSCDLILQEALLHLQELLRLPQPLLVLTPLRLICRRRGQRWWTVVIKAAETHGSDTHW